MINFSSAYAQTHGYEREFVDDFVRDVERENDRQFERLTVTLDRVAAKLDLAGMDNRYRALLSKPLILAAIRERVEHLAAERDITPERIVREQAALAFSNIRNFFNEQIGEDGIPQFDARRASVVDWAAVAALDIEENYSRSGTTRKIKLKMHGKQAAADFIAKYSGLDKADNPTYAAYKMLPAELVQMPASADIADLQLKYARFIDG